MYPRSLRRTRITGLQRAGCVYAPGLIGGDIGAERGGIPAPCRAAAAAAAAVTGCISPLPPPLAAAASCAAARRAWMAWACAMALSVTLSEAADFPAMAAIIRNLETMHD